MDSHRRQQQQLLGEAAVNALCSNLPSRTSALLRTDCRHGNGMGCLPLPWPSRRVLSLPASTYVVPLCAMHGHRSIGMWMRRRTDKRVHCMP